MRSPLPLSYPKTEIPCLGGQRQLRFGGKDCGIEPDYCFYIEHWEAVVGKRRINWRTDPPSDLVLEINVTSYSDVNDYLPYGVPEVWLFKRGQLYIYQLQKNTYELQTHSRYFPAIDLQSVLDRCLQIAYDRNTSAAIRDLRQRLHDPHRTD